MGISGLMKLLSDHAPGAIKEDALKNYFGRKIAVDSSVSIYQFLVVVGRTGEQTLQTETGEQTGHLSGMFYRTSKMLEAGASCVSNALVLLDIVHELPRALQAPCLPAGMHRMKA